MGEFVLDERALTDVAVSSEGILKAVLNCIEEKFPRVKFHRLV